jgi:hypothetical protein
MLVTKNCHFAWHTERGSVLPLSLNRSGTSAREDRSAVECFKKGAHEQRSFGLASPLHRASAFRRFRRRGVVRGLIGVYARYLMGTKLLISVLVLLLSGADFGVVRMCAASCMLSVPVAGTVVHHHEMEAQLTATYASQHAHHHGAPCGECPPSKPGNSLNRKSNCDSLSEIQALQDFSLDAPSRVARALLDRPSANGLALDSNCQQSFLFGDSATSRSSGPPLLPLRI